MDNKDHVAGVCGHGCPGCGTSFDALWKVGDETVLHNSGDGKDYAVKVLANDAAEIVFEVIAPGQYLGEKLHFMKQAKPN